MLAWIFLLFAAGAGIAAMQGGAERLQATPGLPVAIAIIGAMSLLYLMTLRRNDADERTLASRAATLLAFVAAAASSIPALQFAGVWPGLPAKTEAIEPRREAEQSAGRAAVRIRRSDDGRFIAQGDVNGAPMRLVVDSGAASIMLRSSDAEAAGIDVASLAFDTAIETANGAAYVAPVRLRSVTIGAIRIDDVEGFVAKPGSLNENLLGMSFLRRLVSYDLGGDFMTLRQ